MRKPRSKQTWLNATKTFDARLIPCTLRHQIVFQTWDQLAQGDYFILRQDQDPIPIFYQFQADFPGQFTWEYLERGPSEYQVKIGKNPNRTRVRPSFLKTTRCKVKPAPKCRRP